MSSTWFDGREPVEADWIGSGVGYSNRCRVRDGPPKVEEVVVMATEFAQEDRDAMMKKCRGQRFKGRVSSFSRKQFSDPSLSPKNAF